MDSPANPTPTPTESRKTLFVILALAVLVGIAHWRNQASIDASLDSLGALGEKYKGTRERCPVCGDPFPEGKLCARGCEDPLQWKTR